MDQGGDCASLTKGSQGQASAALNHPSEYLSALSCRQKKSYWGYWGDLVGYWCGVVGY